MSEKTMYTIMFWELAATAVFSLVTVAVSYISRKDPQKDFIVSFYAFPAVLCGAALGLTFFTFTLWRVWS